MDGVKKSHVERGGANHHTHSMKDHHGDPATEHFYNKLTVTLADAEELLLMGPGLSKTHFESHLAKHHGGLKSKIIGIENSDHPTDNQILATARKFFKTYNLFNNPT